MNNSKVFLGGTTPNTDPLYGWRGEITSLLEIEYFNPVVEDWTKEDQAEEYRQKEECNVHLYVITSEMKGAFSIAEAVDSAWQKDKITVFHVVPEGFEEGQLKSFEAIINLLKKRNAHINFHDMEEIAEYLNS